jgi:hypothetical protein
VKSVKAVIGGDVQGAVQELDRHRMGDRQAENRFEEALGADLGSWPFQRARLQLAYGQWLRRQRRITDSRAPLREARDTFDALGCAAFSEQTRRELRAANSSTSPTARSARTWANGGDRRPHDGPAPRAGAQAVQFGARFGGGVPAVRV